MKALIQRKINREGSIRPSHATHSCVEHTLLLVRFRNYRNIFHDTIITFITKEGEIAFAFHGSDARA